jgi:hypothetical protein
MYLTEEACQSVRDLPSEFQISAGDEVRLTAGEVEESCGSAAQIAVQAARFTKPRYARPVLLSSSGQCDVLFTKVYGELSSRIQQSLRRCNNRDRISKHMQDRPKVKKLLAYKKENLLGT